MVDSVTHPPPAAHRTLAFDLPEGRIMARIGPSVAQSPRSAPGCSVAHGTWDSNFALNLVYAGSGQYTDAGGQQHLIGPGTAFFRFPDRPHATRIDARPYRESWLVLPSSVYLHLRSLSLLDSQRPVLPFTDSPTLRQHLEAICSIPQLPQRHGAQAWAVFLHHVVGLLAQLRQEPDHLALAPPWLPKARRLLARNLARKLTLDEIATRLGLDTQRFRKEFVAHMGVPPMEYRIRMRIDRARSELLLVSVAEVARTLGFGDPKHFSRQFRSYTGFSPREFQRLGRQQVRSGGDQDLIHWPRQDGLEDLPSDPEAGR